MKLTCTQAVNLRKAIDMAREFGSKKLVGPDGQPQCVLGCLAAIHGQDMKEIRKLDSPDIPVGHIWNAIAPQAGYPRHVIIRLMDIWDNHEGIYSDADRAKKEMHSIVDTYLTSEPNPGLDQCAWCGARLHFDETCVCAK